MTRQRPLVLLLILCCGAGAMALGRGASGAADQGAPAATRPPGSNYKGPAFTFNKIQEGVYHAVGTGSLVVMIVTGIFALLLPQVGLQLVKYLLLPYGIVLAATLHISDYVSYRDVFHGGETLAPLSGPQRTAEN